MPVRVACLKCNKTFTLKDEFAGRKIRCPDCKNIIQVPELNSPSSPTASQQPDRIAPAGGASRPQRSSTVMMSNRQAAAGGADSDATVMMRNRPAPTYDSSDTVPMKAITNACPSCGRSVPAGEQACPFCRYHFKLKRKIGLSQAIHSANMHSQGLNVDGSKKITRADITEERVAEQKKIGKTMVIIVGVALVMIAVAVFFFFHNALQAPTVLEMRGRVKLAALDPQKPETFSPLWINAGDQERYTFRIPVNQIFSQSHEWPKSWPQGRAGWAAFAQAVKPPLALITARIEEGAALPLIAQANVLGGSYAPDLLGKQAPTGDIMVWRLSSELTQSGSLRGAILDFGKDAFKGNEITGARQQMETAENRRQKKIKEFIQSEEAFGKKVSRQDAEGKFPPASTPEVVITGRLSMVPFFDYDLQGGTFSYRGSARLGSPNVRNPDDVSAPSVKDRPGDDLCYFAPVILVNTIQVEQPAGKK